MNNNKEIILSLAREQYHNGEITYADLQQVYFENFIKPGITQQSLTK